MTILKHTLFCALAFLATSAYAQDSFDPTSLNGDEIGTKEAVDGVPAFDMDGNYFLRPGHGGPGHGGPGHGGPGHGHPGHGGPGHGGPGHGHPGHGHPGHGGPGHGHPGYPGPVIHECIAADRFGHGFAARGWASFGILQRQALQSCYNYSRAPRSCRISYCR